MFADLKYAWRQLRKSPGFAVTAVVTLALGIGANTAIFSIIQGALRLPYPHADRMVAIRNVYPQGSYFSVSYPDFIDWRTNAKVFSQLVASVPSRTTWVPSTPGKSEPEVVNEVLVSDGYFRMFGMEPVLGRSFLSSEQRKGGAPVCVLSEQFWREEFNSDPGVVSSTLNLGGKAYTVVGVIPGEKPSGNHPAQIWMPLEANPPWDQHGTNYLFAVGLLRPGATKEHALAELSGLQAQIDRQFPDNKHGVDVQSLAKTVFGDMRSLLLVLLAAVGFILLIACVNLANMLLARASEREREFAVRRALGASAGRMVRQTLTESLLLALLGAIAGLAVALGLTHIPIAAWPKGFVRPSELHLDPLVLGFTALVGLGTGLLFGIIPALRLLRADGKAALHPGRTATDSREHGRTRAMLVIAEIALSMLLIAGALNTALYFLGLLRVDAGVNPRDTMVMTVNLSPQQYPKAADQQRFFDALLERLRTLPGVQAAGAGFDTPFTGSGTNGDFQYEGQPAGTADKNPFAEKHDVTPGYFAAVEAPILQGRDFTPQDRRDAQGVVILNRTMAQKLWPGQSPIGKHVKQQDKWDEVVGVVGDIRYNGPAEPAGFQIYQPVDQGSFPFLTFVLRTRPGSDPLSLATAARQAVASLDPEQAVSNITSLQALSDEAVAGQRTSTMVTAILGALALLLASVGVYGVMAYAVSRRRREFGIRIALGADRGGIARLLFSEVSRLVLTGAILGGVLSIAARAWIASWLGAVDKSGLAMVLAAVLLAAVAAMATALPASRAARVEPMEALRTE